MCSRQKMVVFGTGNRGEKLYGILSMLNLEVEYWIDSDKRKWDKKLHGKKICAPETVAGDSECCICISAMDKTDEMRGMLRSMGIDEKRIWTFAEAVIYLGYEKFQWDNSNSCQDAKKDSWQLFFDCTNGLTLGGVEAWSISLVKELRHRNKMAYLLAPNGDYGLEADIAKMEAFVDIDRSKILSWQNISAILGKLQAELPCCVITSCVNDLMLAACILKKKKAGQVKIISVIHQGLESAYWEHAGLNEYIDCYAAVSEDIRRGLLSQGVRQDKVLHMTCPVGCIDPYSRVYSQVTEPVHIGYAGRIEVEQKRTDYLLLLIEELESLQINYRLEIAGNGSYLETIRDFIEKGNLGNKVHLRGVLKGYQVYSFWAEQDICINLSDYEGRSLSVMEAMKNGAVPIVTATSGVREDISDGRNGYIVDIGDYKGMAQKIGYLEKNREILSVQGNRAHDVMMKKSNMNEHIKFWERILRGRQNAGNFNCDTSL